MSQESNTALTVGEPVNDAPGAGYEYAHHWNEVFDRETENETDRAVIIVAGSLMDTALHELLKNHLVPPAGAEDGLFEGSNAPLATFSARIDMAYRLGLIGVSTLRELHLFRKMRNDCAHNLHGATFTDGAVRSRVLELSRSQPHLVDYFESTIPRSDRSIFLRIASWLLFNLHMDAQGCPKLKCKEPASGLYPQQKRES